MAAELVVRYFFPQNTPHLPAVKPFLPLWYIYVCEGTLVVFCFQIRKVIIKIII
jgi:hypothetical protein